MAVVQQLLRQADQPITSERYVRLKQDYLGAEIRKLSLVPPSKAPGRHTKRRVLREQQTATQKAL